MVPYSIQAQDEADKKGEREPEERENPEPEQPREDIKRLKEHILSQFGGKGFQFDWVLNKDLDKRDVKNLLTRGKLIDGKEFVLREMDTSDCHHNASVLAATEGLDIWTGLALSPDRLWRVHTWNYDPTDKKFIENTVKRNKYFGYKLDTKEHERFVRHNPEQPHGSPGPPIKIPQEWWDDDGRIIMAKHEEEFIDLVIEKFWRRDIFEDEQVETDGAFWGEHNQEQGYEWAAWRGEYRVGVVHYGAEMPSPTAALRLSLRINAIDIASRIITIEMVDDKLAPIDRLFLRQSFEAVSKGGAYFASKADEIPLAIAIDKTHFMLRKLLLHGAKMYPILEWLQISTLTQNGVDPTMQLVAMHPGGGRVTRLAPIDIPTSKFYYDDMIEKGYGLYINLKEQLPERAPGTGGALEKLDFDARMHKELERIFTPGIEVEVEELPITKTSMDEVQRNIDDIEREIRVLRAKEHDFDSTNSTVAARLGKQMQYDKLLKERDELMWRENPSARIERTV
jgi:hypothetical protein